MLVFDAPDAGLEYKHRWAAFGIAEGANGTIALVEVRKPGRPPYFDLPGGAVDAGEDEEAAIIREFGEETGLVVPLGEHVLAQALHHLHEWHDLGYVSVNVSPRQLSEPDFVPTLARLLAEGGLGEPALGLLALAGGAALDDSRLLQNARRRRIAL